MRLSTVATVVAFLAIPTIASAHAGNDDPNVVHACIGNVSKEVRIVGVSGSCNLAPTSKTETPAHWDIQGPQGVQGPQGETGQQGIQGPQGSPGMDATHAAPPCFDNTRRYVECGNGTVTDTVTGLIWLQQADCLPSEDWGNANPVVARLANGVCGLTDGSSAGDWRLPTRDEWNATIAQALILGCYGAAAPPLTNDAGTGCLIGGGSAFTGVVADYYWSSTTNASLPTNAWSSLLVNGGVYGFGKGTFLRVWPVRGGRR